MNDAYLERQLRKIPGVLAVSTSVDGITMLVHPEVHALIIEAQASAVVLQAGDPRAVGVIGGIRPAGAVAAGRTHFDVLPRVRTVAPAVALIGAAALVVSLAGSPISWIQGLTGGDSGGRSTASGPLAGKASPKRSQSANAPRTSLVPSSPAAGTVGENSVIPAPPAVTLPPTPSQLAVASILDVDHVRSSSKTSRVHGPKTATKPATATASTATASTATASTAAASTVAASKSASITTITTQTEAPLFSLITSGIGVASRRPVVIEPTDSPPSSATPLLASALPPTRGLGDDADDDDADAEHHDGAGRGLGRDANTTHAYVRNDMFARPIHDAVRQAVLDLSTRPPPVVPAAVHSPHVDSNEHARRQRGVRQLTGFLKRHR